MWNDVTYAATAITLSLQIAPEFSSEINIGFMGMNTNPTWCTRRYGWLWILSAFSERYLIHNIQIMPIWPSFFKLPKTLIKSLIPYLVKFDFKRLRFWSWKILPDFDSFRNLNLSRLLRPILLNKMWPIEFFIKVLGNSWGDKKYGRVEFMLWVSRKLP